MRYVSLQNLPPDAFKRLVGIPPDLFAEQLMVLEQAERAKRKPGRPSPLSLADQLLLTLGYWREYRTLFHLGVAYGVHESTAQRIVTRTEQRLLAAQADRERLAATENLAADTVVVVDASESPIERPKKQGDFYSGKTHAHAKVPTCD
ncbi:MAG: transposase family protein [Candidatus Thiothrix singaporensis]|uniref:Transposase family protein n=1 Tax=Candidatus Thiothrix singaporensis TaxID=2799669 RepID=A0A7L6ANP6_9GAMM|nr:MAG: transposase family protein [Candidatus Thiothrix singaporensis]